MKKKLVTFTALAGLTTLIIHAINKTHYSISTVKNILSGPNNKYYDWRFGKIRYIKKGYGSPVLLIHDLTVGSSSYEFFRIINKLAEHHEVYAIDLLGYGLSDHPNITYTNYFYVQSVLDFIKNIIGKKTSIIAAGDSASIAIMAAHNDGILIDKIGLINPQSLEKMNQIPNKRTRFYKFCIDIPVFGTYLYNLLTSKEAFRKTFSKQYYFDQSIIREYLIEAYNEAAHIPDYNSKYSFSSYIGRFMNANIIHALKQINHSIFILYGKEKENIDVIVDSYIAYNASIEKFSVSNCKQLPHLENPKAVLEQLEILF